MYFIIFEIVPLIPGIITEVVLLLRFLFGPIEEKKESC